MKVERVPMRSGRLKLAVRLRRFAMHITPGWFRPSLHHFSVGNQRHGITHYGTVGLGLARVSWTLERALRGAEPSEPQPDEITASEAALLRDLRRENTDAWVRGGEPQEGTR